MSSRLQNMIVILGLLVIAGLGYYLFTQNKSSVLDANTETINNQAAIESADFLRKLNELKTISLESDLFSDARFQSLINHRPPLIQEAVGRANPFLEVND